MPRWLWNSKWLLASMAAAREQVSSITPGDKSPISKQSKTTFSTISMFLGDFYEPVVLSKRRFHGRISEARTYSVRHIHNPTDIITATQETRTWQEFLVSPSGDIDIPRFLWCIICLSYTGSTHKPTLLQQWPKSGQSFSYRSETLMPPQYRWLGGHKTDDYTLEINRNFRFNWPVRNIFFF